MAIIFTIGYIPKSWESDSSGDKTIIVGDTDHSNTIEYEYKINDDNFENLTTQNVIDGSMDETYMALSSDSVKLSKDDSISIPFLVMKNIYELCLEETGDVDSWINLYEEGISEFKNNRKKYNECFYCRYLVEEDDEILRDALFVIKPN